MDGKKQLWKYIGGCEYDCQFHKGKVEWHHPITGRLDIGIYLCEAHHSLIQGRRHKYPEEIILDKSLSEMRNELKALENRVVSQAGYNPKFDIDKK